MVKITKAIAREKLANVPLDKQFWCADGRIFKNLSELAAGLEQISEETFRSHANETKNDFSNWVRDVISDETLASDLRKSRSRAQAAKVVADRIAWLKSKK
jgi:hypothetical protein